jgi:hypothetical protein
LEQFATDKFCVRRVESGKVVNGWLLKLQKWNAQAFYFCNFRQKQGVLGEKK